MRRFVYNSRDKWYGWMENEQSELVGLRVIIKRFSGSLVSIITSIAVIALAIGLICIAINIASPDSNKRAEGKSRIFPFVVGGSIVTGILGIVSLILGIVASF